MNVQLEYLYKLHATSYVAITPVQDNTLPLSQAQARHASLQSTAYRQS